MIRQRLLPAVMLALLAGCTPAGNSAANQTTIELNEGVEVEDVSSDGLAAPDNSTIDMESDVDSNGTGNVG